MSVREALRKLSKKFPAAPEIKATLEALRDEPDRSVAIVGTAILEGALEKLIVRCLKFSNAKLIDQLFGNRGPISDFHSKILIAVAFGVISPNMGEELHMVKSIRNAFAHCKVDVSFDTPEIAGAVREFIILHAIDSVEIEPEKRAKFENKNAFIMIVNILLILIDEDHRQHGGEPILARDSDKRGLKSS